MHARGAETAWFVSATLERRRPSSGSGRKRHETSMTPSATHLFTGFGGVAIGLAVAAVASPPQPERHGVVFERTEAGIFLVGDAGPASDIEKRWVPIPGRGF